MTKSEANAHVSQMSLVDVVPNVSQDISDIPNVNNVIARKLPHVMRKQVKKKYSNELSMNALDG